MPDNIFTFVTDAISSDEIITARTQAVVIEVFPSEATVGFLIRRPDVSSPQAPFPPGASVKFYPRVGTRHFAIGDVVAYISSASGSLTMIQKED